MLPIIALLIAMLSIQSGASLAKQVFPLAGVQGTTTLRVFFAALILCAIWRPWRKKLTSLEKRNVLIYGAALGVMNLLFYLSIQKIPLGIAVALEFTGPLAIALFASRKKLDFLWAFLAVVGIIFVLPLNQTSQHLDPLGIIFALAAGVCWALYILFGQRIGKTLHGGFAASIGMAVAALVVLPFGIAESGFQIFHWSLLPMGFAVAIFSSALPYSLEMVALKALPTRTFGILMSLEPAVAALAGLTYLGEHLEVIQWLAVACIIVASAGSSLSVQQKSLQEKTPLDNL
jgi:inner membrane transporter RhtA